MDQSTSKREVVSPLTLAARTRKLMESQPRVKLAHTPTPLLPARRLSAALNGPQIFIKRDDLTGLATGGNKARKLEFLIADALRQRADCVITAGGLQSNHCRQTAAAAAQCGLACHLVVGGHPPEQPAGNLFLDHLLGARLHWVSSQQREERMNQLACDLQARGAAPYVIPIGGSNPRGALGYVLAMCELVDQLSTMQLQMDHIVFATSSGGTQAGLVLGAALTGFEGQITGISIDQPPDETSSFKYRQFIGDISNRAARQLAVTKRVAVEDIRINYDYLGDGYGVVGDLEREAVQLLARTEGVLVGPVYTGRALGGLVDLVRRGSYRNSEQVLFWHTGDESALHAYVSDFVGASSAGRSGG